MSDMFALGLACFQKRDFSAAEDWFSKALLEKAANPNYLFYRASARMELGKFEESAADLSAALAVADQLPIRYTRGEVYLTMGDLEKAAADFSSVIASAAEDGRYWRSLAYLGRGLISLEAGDVESALLDLGEAEDLARAEGDKALLARISSELERSGF